MTQTAAHPTSCPDCGGSRISSFYGWCIDCEDRKKDERMAAREQVTSGPEIRQTRTRDDGPQQWILDRQASMDRHEADHEERVD